MLSKNDWLEFNQLPHAEQRKESKKIADQNAKHVVLLSEWKQREWTRVMDSRQFEQISIIALIKHVSSVFIRKQTGWWNKWAPEFSPGWYSCCLCLQKVRLI